MVERSRIVHIKLASLVKVFLAKPDSLKDQEKHYRFKKIEFKCLQDEFNVFIDIVFHVQVMTMNDLAKAKFDYNFLLTEISLVLVSLLLADELFYFIHDFTGVF